MDNPQSYNHFMPQSLIKTGWGYHISGNKQKSVNILNYNRLKDFIIKKPNFTRDDLENAFSNNFGNIDINNNLIIRRNPDSIMGNKLVFNITEQKLGNMQIHIEKNIESVIFDAVKTNTIEQKDISQFHNWFALQKSRSIAELMNCYFYFLSVHNITKINNEEQYLEFKKLYNKSVHMYFDEYTRKYYNDKYKVYIPQFNNQNLYLFLGELNTLHSANFIKCILANSKHLKKFGLELTTTEYCLLNFIDVSLVSKNKILLICHPKITVKEMDKISQAIVTCWNAYQVAQETTNLVVDSTFNSNIELIIDIIMEQHYNKTLDRNINYQQEYLDLLTISNYYEKKFKVD